MTHRNKMIATLNLASILGIASLGQVHAESYGAYLADGIFWSSVGAAGQVDPRSAEIALTKLSKLTMAAPGTLVVRYSVTPSAELATATGTVRLMANLSDRGADASVDVTLFEVPIEEPGEKSTSSPRSILHLSCSDADAEGVTTFMTRCVAAPSDAFSFDFTKNVYFIHAVLSWNAEKQPYRPALHAVQIGFGTGDDKMCPASQ